MLIVHHGMFFRKDSPVVKGPLKERLRLLLESEISLLAYHLPLDAHPEIGHSALGAKSLGMKNVQPFETYGVAGELDIDRETFFNSVKSLYGQNILIFPYGPNTIKRIAIISGGAPDYLAKAIDAGMDAFITGEVKEFVMHTARENNIHFIAAGHYATERLGIIALTEMLNKKFDVDAEFIDIPNPV